MANCTNGAKDLNNFVSKCRKRSNNGWPFKSVYEMKTKCSNRSTAIFFGQPCVWYGTSSIYSTLAVNVDAIREHKSRKPKIGSCISQLLSSSEIGHFVRMCSRVKMRRDANRKTKWTEGRRLYVTWRWYWCGAHVVDSVNVSCFLKQLASHTAAAAAAVAAANDAPYELFIVGSCSFWTRSTHIDNDYETTERGVLFCSSLFHIPSTVEENRLARSLFAASSLANSLRIWPCPSEASTKVTRTLSCDQSGGRFTRK